MPTLTINGTAGNDALAVTETGVGSGYYVLNVSIFSYSGISGFVFDGAVGNDTMTGTSGADVFTGGEGSDFIIVGLGNDVLVV